MATADEALRTVVWEVLATIQDPELPVTVTDLGIIEAVGVHDGCVRVEMIPTFTGCPALEVMRREIDARLRALPGVREVTVQVSYARPWTVDRISQVGRLRLRRHGVGLAQPPEPVRCPVCGSTNTIPESPFGPTPCRALAYCPDCRNPLEYVRGPAD